MGSPIANKLGAGQQAMNPVSAYMQYKNSGRDLNAVMQQMIQQNPNLEYAYQQAKQLSEMYGGTSNAVQQVAQQKGIDISKLGR